MKGLLIIGAGGHGKVVAETALLMMQWNKIGFLDDHFPLVSGIASVPVLGVVGDAGAFLTDYSHVVVAIGDNRLRLQLLNHLVNMGFSAAVIVHPQSTVSPSAVLEGGTVVFAQAAINYGAHIGRGGIVNTGATIDHECSLGAAVHVSPGAHLAGRVRVGDYAWIGIGAIVIHNICIEAAAVVGAGAAVIRDVAANTVVTGVPARNIYRIKYDNEGL